MSADTGDRVLWQSFKSGDRDAFRSIYDSYFGVLYEYGMRTLSDKALIKDAIHDLFVKMWSNRTNLGDVSYLRSYLITALRNIIFSLLESRNRIRFTDAPDGRPFNVAFVEESHFIKRESDIQQSRKLIAALNQLTDRQKEAVYLRYIEGMEYAEIAEVMGITVKGTYKLTGRGIEALRQILDPGSATLGIIILLTRMKNFF